MSVTVIKRGNTVTVEKKVRKLSVSSSGPQGPAGTPADNLWKRIGTDLQPFFAGDSINGVPLTSAGDGTLLLDNSGTYRLIDHGELSGLGDDDHTQYHTDARALTWFNAGGAVGQVSGRVPTAGVSGEIVWVDPTAVGLSDHGSLLGLGDDDHTQYHTDVRALSWMGTRSTTDLPEGTNLYYTQARFDTAFSGKSTTDLSEGTNLYYTNERVDDRVSALIQNGTGISWSYNDVGNTLTPTVTLLPFSTTDLSEGTNLYYTQARFDSAFTAKSTTDLSEGTNLYYTQSRFDSAFTAKSTTDLSEGTNLYYTQGRFDTAFTAKDTDALSEGITNLYHTTARVQAVIDADTTLVKVDGSRAFTGTISGIDPTLDAHLATKKYVDDSVAVENLWDRSGTILSPTTAGDGITVDGASIINNTLTINKTNGVLLDVVQGSLTSNVNAKIGNSTHQLEIGSNSDDIYLNAVGTGVDFYIRTEGVNRLSIISATAVFDTSTPVRVDNVTTSTSTSTGALVVGGGVGIAKELYVGLDATFNTDAGVNDFIIKAPTTGNAYQYDASGTNHYYWGNRLIIDAGVRLSNNEFFWGNDTLGTEHLLAGVTTGDQMVFGPFSSATVNQLFFRAGDSSVEAQITNTITTFNVASKDRDFTIKKLTSGDFLVYDAGLDTATIDSQTSITDATASASVSTGALVVSGGIGIAKDAFIGGGIYSQDGGSLVGGIELSAGDGAMFAQSPSAIADATYQWRKSTGSIVNLYSYDEANDKMSVLFLGTGTYSFGSFGTGFDFTSDLKVSSTTASTSTTTGALTVAGGVGVVENLHVGGSIYGILDTTVTATTQSAGDNSTKVATTAYVDNTILWTRVGGVLIPSTGTDGMSVGGPNIFNAFSQDADFTIKGQTSNAYVYNAGDHCHEYTGVMGVGTVYSGALLNLEQNMTGTEGGGFIRSIRLVPTITGTASDFASQIMLPKLDGAFTQTNTKGLQIYDVTTANGASATNYVGVVIRPLSTATNSTHLLIGQGGIPTGNWAIYSASTYDSQIAGDVAITSTTASTSTTTGTLVVSGGIGIAGDVYSGGQFVGDQGSVSAPTYSFIGGENYGMFKSAGYVIFSSNGVERFRYSSDGIDSDVIIQTTAGVNSTSATTGSLIVYGGVGITQDVNIAGSIKLGSSATISEFSTDGTLFDNSDSAVPTEQAVKTYVDGLLGGVDLWQRVVTTLSPKTAGDSLDMGTTSIGAGGLDLTDGVNIGTLSISGAGINFVGQPINIDSITNITDTTASTSISTGSLVLSGGLGVAGRINAGDYIQAQPSSDGGIAFRLARNSGDRFLTINSPVNASASDPYIFQTPNAIKFTLDAVDILEMKADYTSTFYRQLSVTDATASTSTTTGALVVTGGLGLGGALYVGGSSVFNANAGDVDFTINQNTSGTAYVYDAGLKQHTWNASGEDGFNLVSDSGNCGLNLTAGVSSATLIEMTAGGNTWRNNITTSGDWKFRDHTATQDILFIRKGIGGTVADYTTTGLVMNGSAIDYDLTLNKLTSGTALVYDAGLDSMTIGSKLELTESVSTSAIETITASSDTLDDTNHVVLCDCTSNAITINLPTASGNNGLTYKIKKIDSTVNAVTVDGSGAELIDGATTATIGSQYDSITIVSNGTSWFIV